MLYAAQCLNVALIKRLHVLQQTLNSACHTYPHYANISRAVADNIRRRENLAEIERLTYHIINDLSEHRSNYCDCSVLKDAQTDKRTTHRVSQNAITC